jgi:hypothetical protein
MMMPPIATPGQVTTLCNTMARNSQNPANKFTLERMAMASVGVIAVVSAIHLLRSLIANPERERHYRE